jgi:hypothetical protein
VSPLTDPRWERPDRYLDPAAECFLGERVEVHYVPHAAIGTIAPGYGEIVAFQMPESGVPLGLTGLGKGLRVTHASAGGTRIYPGAEDLGLGSTRKLVGAMCSEREVVVFDITNRTEQEIEFHLTLFYAKPPVVYIPLEHPSGGAWGEKHLQAMRDVDPIVRIVRRSEETERFDGIRVPLRLLAVLPLKSVGLIGGSGVVHSCEGQCYDRWLGPIALVLDEECAEHYFVSRIIMGEMPVVTFTHLVSGRSFRPRLEDSFARPPMPFFLCPPRQVLRVEGVRVGGGPAPPLSGRIIGVPGDRMVA